MKALSKLWVLCLGDVQALEEDRERAHSPLRNREHPRYQLGTST